MKKKILDYNEYINRVNESEDIKLASEKNKYDVQYSGNGLFVIIGDSIYKEYRIPSFDEYMLEKLKMYYNQLIEYISNEDPYILYSIIKTLESLNLFFVNVQPEKFLLQNNKSIMDVLDDDKKTSLLSSEDQFLLTEYDDLDEDIQNKIFKYIKNRAQYLCCIIESIFYYERKTNKKKYYNLHDIHEIFNMYQKKIMELSRKYNFIWSGPFNELNGNSYITQIDDSTSYIYYNCAFNNKIFTIKCVTSISELYKLEEITSQKGLKFSILDNKGNVEDDFDNINEDELYQKMEEYLKK